jgi:hypothetical protein
MHSPRFLVGAALALTFLAAAPFAPSPSSWAAPTPAPSGMDEEHARVAAAASHSRVVVTAMTNQTRRVVANPDGSFTMTESVLPIRVRRGAGWVPVDTTLARTADGMVAPRATVLDIAFSGGGSVPLARLRDGAREGTVLPGEAAQAGS